MNHLIMRILAIQTTFYLYLLSRFNANDFDFSMTQSFIILNFGFLYYLSITIKAIHFFVLILLQYYYSVLNPYFNLLWVVINCFNFSMITNLMRKYSSLSFYFIWFNLLLNNCLDFNLQRVANYYDFNQLQVQYLLIYSHYSTFNLFYFTSPIQSQLFLRLEERQTI